MWNRQHASKMHPRIRVLDGVSEGEAGLEMHTENRGERKAQDEVTDDDVLKELMNIVMDVFSNKSEKCLLTFELPVESGVLKEIPPEELAMRNGSEVSSNASKSDIEIPLENAKNFRKRSSRMKRNLRVPMTKASKYKLKKKLKKRLNPTVQTGLSTKPCFNGSEQLFWMHPKQSNLTEVCNDRHGSITEPTRNAADGCKDAAERDALLNKVSDLKEKMAYQPQRTDNNAFINLYNEFKDVIEALEELAYSREPKLAKLSFGELSYHLHEIQCHIEAIRDSLQDSQSFESVNTMLHLTLTESSLAPKGKNKVGVKLIRIGAKIGRKSSMQIAAGSKKLRKHKKPKEKLKSTQEIGLGDILKNYQKVKKEETEIVQVLLGKLGFNKYSNNKRRKNLPKTPKQELFETVQPCSVTVEKIQCREVARKAMNIQDDFIEANDETLDEPQCNNITDLKPKQVSQSSVSEDRQGGEQRNDRNRKEISRKHKKHREPRKSSREIASNRSRDCRDTIHTNNRKYSPIILYGRPSPLCIGGGEEKITRKVRKDKVGNATNFMEQTNPGAAFYEGRMRHQIESAAKRLEHMHSLVERKLNRLSKQQKDLNRKLTREHCGNHTPRKSRSNDGSQNEVHKLTKESSLNLSPEIEELIFQPYQNVKFENIKENLSCNVNALKHAEEIPRSGKLGRHSSSRLETQGSLDRENFLSKNHQNYIPCNYMMEIREKALEHASAGSMDNQRGSELGHIGDVFSSAVLTNEFQESSSTHGRENDLPTSTLLSVTTKENEGEIIEESLFANQHLSNKTVHKSTGQKKKKRVIYTPLCTLS